ncbi:MAG: tRNA pseudouridine(38-40) synthase TruA [Nitrospiria bacterium]
MVIVKLTVAYDGADYHGWQKQPDLKTVQGSLEAGLKRITGNSIPVYGAGRTDAGVHARGQVAHFISPLPFDSVNWLRALNATIPKDIVVHAAEAVSDSFHARFSAKGKTYTYYIHNGLRRCPHQRRSSWFVPARLDLDSMRATAGILMGEHDFTSFAASNGEAKDCQLLLKEVLIEKRDDRITITLNAHRFLKYMVRNIVGFLVEVGRGKVSVDEVSMILRSRDRSMAALTAPPQGLFLDRVEY